MRFYLLVIIALSSVFVSLASAQCRTTHIPNETSPVQLDYGFCFAALTEQQYSCEFDVAAQMTVCRTASNAPDFILDWYGTRARVLNTDGKELGRLVLRSGAPAKLYWFDDDGEAKDIDTCSVKRNGIVEWCGKQTEGLCILSGFVIDLVYEQADCNGRPPRRFQPLLGRRSPGHTGSCHGSQGQRSHRHLHPHAGSHRLHEELKMQDPNESALLIGTTNLALRVYAGDMRNENKAFVLATIRRLNLAGATKLALQLRHAIRVVDMAVFS